MADLSAYTDEQLAAMAGVLTPAQINQQTADIFDPQPVQLQRNADLSGISNDELMRAAGINQAEPAQAVPQAPQAAAGTPETPSFLGEMGVNAKNALQSAKDLVSGNYEDIGRTLPTPKTQALGNKLFPEGSDGSFLGALGNLGNTSASDWSGALLEKLGNTPEGKALSVIGGLHPLYNAASTAVNRYVNPAIEKATGIAPDNLALLELAGGAAGFKKAGQVNDPLAGLAKSAAQKVMPTASDGIADTAALARKYDIPLSFDQISDSRAVKAAQKISQDLPLSGQAAFRDAQMKAFNQNILKTVGETGDRITPEVMDRAFKRVGGEFDSIGKGKTFAINTLDSDINNIRSVAETTATKDALSNFDSMVKEIRSDAGLGKQISGEKLNNWRVRVNERARKANNADTQELFHDLENAIVDTMTTNDPALKAQLATAKQQYKNLLAIEPLAQKAKGGNISPTELQGRVSKIYGRQYTRGKAGEIGDLARIGKELLSQLGGSDTQAKLAHIGLGAGIANPATALPTIAGLAANRGAQALLNRNQFIVDSAIKNAARKAATPANTSGLPALVGTLPAYAPQTVTDSYLAALAQAGNQTEKRKTIPARRGNN